MGKILLSLALFSLVACAAKSPRLPSPSAALNPVLSPPAPAAAPPPDSRAADAHGTAPSPPPASPLAPTTLEIPPPPTVQVEQPFQPTEALRYSISQWIRQNPESDFEDAARAANRFMRQEGFPLVLDVSGMIPKDATSFRMKAGIQTFIFDAGKELSPEPGPCGERYLTVPGRLLGGDRAELVAKEQEYPFSLQGFRRESFRVWKKRKLLNTLFAPDPSEPIGLAANGSALYLKFPLDEAPTGNWWVRMAREQPALLDEDPYLVIRVSKAGLYFDENLEHLPPQDFDVEEKEKSLRWTFEKTGLVLELDGRCDRDPKARHPI